MNIITGILAFLIAISVLVTIHEYGHFWVARRFGIKVLRFSIGFGKPLWRRVGKDGTEYVIAWLPLGGYVKLLDEREGEVPPNEKHLEFNTKPLWVRAAVLLAGPVTNWLLGIILFWIIFLVGIEQPKPIIGKVLPNSIAAQAGIKPQDQISQIDTHETATWMRAMIAIIYRLGEKGDMVIKVLPQNSSESENRLLHLAQWQVSGLTPEPLKSLGIVPYTPNIPPVIKTVLKNGAADKGGLMPGDKITAVAGVPVKDWENFLEIIQKNPGKTINITFERDSQKKNLNILIGKKVENFKEVGFLGIAPQAVEFPDNMKYKPQYNVLTALGAAWNETAMFTKFNYVVLGKMVIGQVSFQGLGGPITIFTSADNALKQGIIVYLSFLALFSVMLASINILPIPGLDGGHLLLLLIELVRGRPLPVATQILLLRVGIIVLIVIMFQATVNDVMRLF